MIDVYSWPTPNGHKVHIMLEETGLEYRVIDARPPVQRGVKVLASNAPHDPKSWDIMFGKTQFQRR